jgi:hypothetical protein
MQTTNWNRILLSPMVSATSRAASATITKVAEGPALAQNKTSNTEWPLNIFLNFRFLNFPFINVLVQQHRTNRDRTYIEYVGIISNGIGRRSASSGRKVSAFKVNIKQAKFSKISI